jgi:hypothetical protein
MKNITINHTSIEQNLHVKKEISDLLLNAQTLVLGSFNPHNPNGNNADFYYGRGSNYFWPIIARLKELDEQYYSNSIERKITAMKEHSFCFTDIISKIEISGIEAEDYACKKIFSGYSDQVLFTTNTIYQGSKIEVYRTYNQNVLEVLKNGKIQTVIHTMGNNRIDKYHKTKPKERGNYGFQNYWQQLRNSIPGVIFDSISFSPSAYAVRVGGEKYLETLTEWINNNLKIK